MSTKRPLSEVIATRCAPTRTAKLDELLEVLLASSPIAVELKRSDVVRAALEAGVDALLTAHRRAP